MFQIDFASRIPIYEQICNSVIRLSSAGVLKPGDKLPPVRTLAAEMGINPNTVAKSYRDLESSGYIYTSVGRGSFITDKLSKENAKKLTAIDELETAVNNAYIFGVTKNEMIEIINKKFGGGEQID